MGTRTIILGGGVGGVVTANTLRALLGPEHEIVVIDKGASFNLGATNTWVMLGRRRREEIQRPRVSLARRGIEVVQAEVTRIDAAKRAVVAGSPREADYLVLALGADYDLGTIPGLGEAAETFYTLDGAIRMGDALGRWKGGDLVVLNPRMPIKCPAAPYEAAMLLHDRFSKDGRTRIAVHTVEPIPMPTAGPEIGAFIKGELAKRGIAFHPQRKVKSVDPTRRVVVFEDGEARFDMLVTIPPHVCPRVVRDGGLTDAGGWVPVDPKTLRTSFDRVWAIGDVTTVPLPGRYKPDVPLALPKAAVFAEAQGRVVAAQIAAHARGQSSSDAFDGKGFCFVEVGGQQAMTGEGLFFTTPQPRMTPRAPDAAQLQEKVDWADGFLGRNFD
jgi:sulfide:quinone oxidoreductase